MQMETWTLHLISISIGLALSIVHISHFVLLSRCELFTSDLGRVTRFMQQLLSERAGNLAIQM